MKKFAAFDLETAKAIPEEDELRDEHFAELGITCAAAALSDKEEIMFWYKEREALKKKDSIEIVNDLYGLVKDGYDIVTWNGCGFDFRVLAHESGMFKECAEIALNHIDMMLYVTFTKGWYLGLQKALEGAGLDGKLKEVELTDGSILEGMSGIMAPSLWFKGEHEAVLLYLEQDVAGLINLVNAVQASKAIKWTSNAGRPQTVKVPKLVPVKECFNFEKPDTSWMKEPPTREQFVKWMPDFATLVKI